MQQKVVLKLDVHNDTSCKQKVMKMVSSIPGIESISVDIKDKKVTVIGDMDPISVVKKLRKSYHTDIVSVGPAKEPEKPKKPEEPKPVVQVTEYAHPMQFYNLSSETYQIPPPYIYRSVEEYPNICVIC